MAPHTPHRSDAPRRSRGAPRARHRMSHRSSWGAPIWPPTPPIARTRPGAAVARLGLDTGCLIDRRGGPRYGPPASSSEGGYAPLGLPRPSRGRAPAQPWRASGLTQDGSSIVVGGPDMAPQPLQAKGRSEEHTSELQSRLHLVCRLLLEKKKNKKSITPDP